MYGQQSEQNLDVLKLSQRHLVIMRRDIRGAWRESVQVQDLFVDLVLRQNLYEKDFVLGSCYNAQCIIYCDITGSVSSRQDSRSTKLNTVLAIRLVTPGQS